MISSDLPDLIDQLCIVTPESDKIGSGIHPERSRLRQSNFMGFGKSQIENDPSKEYNDW